MRANESYEQISFMDELELRYPEVFLVTHHSPNEGKRTVFFGKKLKRMGMKAGWPDIFIAYPVAPYHGLFIELKDGKNRLTSSQSEMMRVLRLRGYNCCVCYGAQEAMDIVKIYLGK